MRERGARNRIEMLINDFGCTVDKPNDIKAEIVSFYKQLLGTSLSLKALNPSVLWQGSMVE